MDSTVNLMFLQGILASILYIITTRAMITIGPGMYPSNRTLNGGPHSVLVLGSCEFMHNGTLSNFNFYVATTDWMALQIWRPTYRDSLQMTLIYHRLVQPAKAHRVIQLWIEDEHINVTNGDRLGLVKLNHTFPVPFMFNPQLGGDLWFRRLTSENDIPKVSQEYGFEELSFPYHFSITVTFKPDISDFYSRYIDKLSREEANATDYKGLSDIEVDGLPQKSTDILKAKGGVLDLDENKYVDKGKINENLLMKSGNLLSKEMKDRSDYAKSFPDAFDGKLSPQDSSANKMAAIKSNTLANAIDPSFNTSNASNKNISSTSQPSQRPLTPSDNKHDSLKFNPPSDNYQRGSRNVSLSKANELSRYFVFTENESDSPEHTTEKQSLNSLDNITDVQGASNIGLDKGKFDFDFFKDSTNPDIASSQSTKVRTNTNSGIITNTSKVTSDFRIGAKNNDITMIMTSQGDLPTATAPTQTESNHFYNNQPTTDLHTNAQPLQSPNSKTVDSQTYESTTLPSNQHTVYSSNIPSSTFPSNQYQGQSALQSEKSIRKRGRSDWSFGPQQSLRPPVDTGQKRNGQFFKSVGPKTASKDPNR